MHWTTNIPQLAPDRRSRGWAAAFLAVLATAFALLISLPGTAMAATDPDIDPAQPIELGFDGAAGSAVITHAEAFLQETAEGLRYIRIDYEVANLGNEPLIGHRWALTLGEIDTAVASGGTIGPGETLARSFLLFGKSVDQIEAGGTSGSLQLTGATAAGSTSRSCLFVFSRPQCEAIGASMQDLCNARKIAQGCHAGVMICVHSCFHDDRGEYCCSDDPDCKCVGRPAELTLDEAVFEGLMPSDDPYINPALGEERWLSVRPFSRDDP